ncbi:MAG: MoxR family ATPase [Caldilineaceae bacterium]|nr:MoxR family ATPase [Caldilineaceae bacterium]
MDIAMPSNDLPDISAVAATARRLVEQISRVIVGKDAVVELLLVALFCDGHVLLEDVPGIGKTMLAKTLARSLGCTFSRIQFTPDLLPSDITGVNIFNQKTGDFEYRGGPILAEVVLADEINRAGPRTQSALLEAMEERQVTVDGVTRPLAYPFLVLATQNPVELEGTFPLPEAQLDRFMLRVAIGYPGREDERTILRRFRTHNPLVDIQPLIGAAELRTISDRCRQVACHPLVEDYLLDLVSASRGDSAVELGVSPRGSLALLRAGQALAAIRGRDFVTPDDLQTLARPVLAHRLILSPESRLRGQSADAVIKRLLDQTPVPVEEQWSASR